MESYISRAERVVSQIGSLGEISDEGRILTRLFGTKAHSQVLQRVLQWMEAYELEARIDNMGNVRGRLRGKEGSHKVFVMGSHLDTARNAGKYDGILGVLLALDAVRNLKAKGVELPFDVEVVGFSDEEGVRFNIAYLGSSVLTGNFQEKWLNKSGIYGKMLSSVITDMGGDVKKIAQDAIPQEEWLGFLEVHVEQGRVLFEKDLPVGVVSSISGQTRINLFINGTRGHAGTTPMELRKDALAAAAAFIHQVETYALQHSDKLVATVGSIHSYPNIANIIPSKVRCSLDIRSPQNDVMDRSTAELEQQFHSLIQQRGLKGQWEISQRNPSVVCDAQLRTYLIDAMKESGVKGLEAIDSGAGHDAVCIAEVAPTAMLFVQCKNGINHHPEEYVSPETIEAAIRVVDKFWDQIIN